MEPNSVTAESSQSLTNLMPLTFNLSFQNLTYSINPRRKLAIQNCFGRNPVENTMKRTLLNDVSGEARDGEILAILGPSGSGKSTLLDALANRINKDSLKGSITLNGERLESRLLKEISAYVMQDDLLYPMLTVEETLMFAAEFKLPSSLAKPKKMERVQAVIDQLGLRNAAKTIIGDEGHRGVSGGERRRVTIGIEIIHDPIILFLDEPTSGLDSSSAFTVVNVLQQIARSGSVVIMSIHQPGYRIDGLLDRVLFLSHGQIVYNGSPASLPSFWGEFGYRIPENENQIEFTLDLIQELEGSSSTGVTRLVEFNKYWQSTKQTRNPDFNPSLLPLKDAIRATISKGKLASGEDSSSRNSMTKLKNPISSEILVLTRRLLLNNKRKPDEFLVKLGVAIVTGFFLATLFWQVDNSPEGVRERFGFFVYAISVIFFTCSISMIEFMQDRYIFIRETASNMYRRSSYVISHSITALPSLVLLSLAFTATVFWSVGLAGDLSGFLFFFAITFAAYWAGSSFVTFLAGVVPNVMSGYTIVINCLAISFLFIGFFANADTLPSYWIWFHYISLMKSPYGAAMMNEFSNPRKCFGKGINIFDNTPFEGVQTAAKIKLLKTLNNSFGLNITESTCITTGAQILRQNGIHDLSKWDYLMITIAWGFFYRVLFYFTLLIGSKNKRK